MQKIKDFLFKNESLRQTVLKNTFWMAFGHTGSRLIRAILIIYAARVLGVAGYGVFSYALSLAGFFTIFADIGLTPFLTRESARNPEQRKEFLSTALFIKFFFIAISSLIILFGAPAIARLEGAKILFPIIVFLFAFDTLRDFFFSLTRSIEKMELEAGVNILTNTAILVLGGAALILAPTAKNLTIGYALGTGVGLFVLLFVLREHLKGIWNNFRKELIKPILTEAWPFALNALLGTIMLNTDLLMLGWLKGAEEVGLYSAGQKVILLLYLLPGFLAVSLFPSFSRLAREDKERFRSIFEQGLRLIFLMAFPIVVGGVLLAPKIISFLYGNPYLPATPAFSILLLTPLLVFPGILFSNAIFAYDRQRLFVGFVALGAIGNVVFNAFLIPRYDIFGAAIATLLAQILANGFNFLAMKKIQEFRLLVYLPKIVGATIVMTIILLISAAFEINVLGRTLIGAITYLTALVIFKEPLIGYLNPLALLRRLRQ